MNLDSLWEQVSPLVEVIAVLLLLGILFRVLRWALDE